MLSIDWRSPADYRFARSIPAAGFAWEYLRRDEEYCREFLALTASQEPDPEQLEAFTQRWGLRFSDRSRNPVRSTDPVLEPKPSAAGHMARPGAAS